MRHELNCDGIDMAWCTVERLAGEMGIAGSRARRTRPRTTAPSRPGDPRPPDLLGREFMAPASKRLRVTDITDVETASGFVYAAFIRDLFYRVIAYWQVSDTLRVGTRQASAGRRKWGTYYAGQGSMVG